MTETTRDPKLPPTIGIDYGANGSYVYEPVVGSNPKALYITRNGRDLWHVDQDTSGNWLYRMRRPL